MSSEEWNGNDIKENVDGLFQVLCQQLLGFSEKNTQNVSQDSQRPGYQSQQLKWTPPQYKQKPLPLHLYVINYVTNPIMHFPHEQ